MKTRQKPIILRTFDHEFSFSAEYKDLEVNRKLINLHYVNDEHANHLVDGRYVSKYPEIEKSNPDFKEAHWSLNAGHRLKVKIDFMSDGSYRISKK